MTPEYFSALNEADAKQFIGKIMEFADRYNIIKQEGWVKKKFKGYTNPESHYSFKSHKDVFWNFMRTCPETFAPVKKVFEKWVTIYPSGWTSYYNSKEDANRSASLDKRIVCLHIKQEYEVKE